MPDEALLRLGLFAGPFALLALAEALAPRRALQMSRLLRWPANLTVLLLDGLIVRLLFPLGLAGIALALEQRGIGLFQRLDLPLTAVVVLSLLVLDLAIYWQHRLFHAVPLFWRFHSAHHTDGEIDLTTGVRFHPVEILLSLLLKVLVIAVIGAPAIAVLAFEILLSTASLFVHSNLRLPLRLDASLRWLVVTPDMHRVHHSRIGRELRSNYGTGLSVWDRLFGSYTAQPELGHQGMETGLPGQMTAHQRIDSLLVWPWREGRQLTTAASRRYNS